MNTSNVFQFKRSTRIGSLTLYALFGVLMGSFLFNWPDFDGLSDRLAVGDYPSVWGVLGFLIFASLIFLEIWLFLNYGLFTFAYRVTLTSESIEIQGRDFFLRKFFNGLNNGYFLGSIPYENIKFIDTDFWRPGIGKITLQNGETILLGIRSLENHREFIKQLTEKLSQIQVGESVEKLARPKRFGVLQTAIAIIGFLPTVFLMTEVYFRDNITHIWNEELSAWGVDRITMDADGSIWASAGGYKSDIYAWHLSESRRDHWTLPLDTCEDCGVTYITHDSQNQPIILDTLSNENAIKAYAWDGTDWNQSVIEGDYSNFFDRTNAYGSTVWGTQNDALVQINFSSGKRTEFPFPEFVKSNQLKLRDFISDSEDTLLARFISEGKPDYLYRFSHGKWQGPILTTSEEESLWVFCQDAEGAIWAIVSETSDGSLELKHPRIGYYNPAISSWMWEALSLGESDRYIAYYKDMATDRYGRVWVSGVYRPQSEDDHYLTFVSVFQPGGEDLELIVEYTDKNSNIDNGGQILITEDRVWIEDFSLRWIDIQTERLPSPLPDWIVWGFEMIDENFGWTFVILIAQFALLFLAQSLEYK